MIKGCCICLIATIIRVKGQSDLKYAFSTRVELQSDHSLVQTGLYRYIRHPLYLAIILLLAGADIMLCSAVSWAFTVAVIYFIMTRIRAEETFLKQKLEGYGEYIKVTCKMIPFIY
jgi:protein-S-isoprenylcysteine O-methyltransferase